MKKAIFYIVILGLVCTGLGIAVGVAIDKIYIKTHFPQIIKSYYLNSNAEERQRIRTHRIIKQLSRELDLSNEQVDRIKDIIKQARPEIDRFREDLKNDFIKIRRKIITNILEVLDFEQRDRFQKILKDETESLDR